MSIHVHISFIIEKCIYLAYNISVNKRPDAYSLCNCIVLFIAYYIDVYCICRVVQGRLLDNKVKGVVKTKCIRC